MHSNVSDQTINIFKNGHNGSLMQQEEVRSFVKDFYENTIKTNKDFEQGACCIPSDRRLLSIHELLPKELLQHNYGCGTTIPMDDLSGLNVADWGCGSGVDCFTLAHLVGPEGKVYGIDMSEEQLKRARSFIPAVVKSFGYVNPNIEFHQDYIECGDAIPENSLDLVVSNCVINLSPKKDQVFKSIFDKLKEGGEVYFSDVVLDRRLPSELFEDPQIFTRLVGECIGGALYIDDLINKMKSCGFADPRIVKTEQIREEIEGFPVNVYSVEMRAFKITEQETYAATSYLEPMDSQCEDYGQMAIYKGNLHDSPARFTLDDHHIFERNKPEHVCRNTARMLKDTRLAQYFEVTELLSHFGIFPCGPDDAKQPSGGETPNLGACC